MTTPTNVGASPLAKSGFVSVQELHRDPGKGEAAVKAAVKLLQNADIGLAKL